MWVYGIPFGMSDGNDVRSSEEKKFPAGCIVAIVAGSIFLAVVVAMILLAIPAYEKTLVRTKSAVAKNVAQTLQTSVIAYHVRHGEWPVMSENGVDTTLRSEGVLVDVLSGKGSPSGPGGGNPDGTSISASQIAQVRSEESGEVVPTIIDVWGRAFFIRMDTDGDGEVEDPSGPGRLARKVLVWSAGPDGDAETWEDNVVSW